MAMIDISEKKTVRRTALAKGILRLAPGTISAIRGQEVRKGDPLKAAEASGMLAVKQTPHLIPHCHQIPISSINFEFHLGDSEIIGSCEVTAVYKTGVEMDALVGITNALLTIWDMVKYLEKDNRGQYPDAEINSIRIIEKTKEE